MTKELIGQDECYKYMIKKLKVRFVRRLGYDCEEVIFINTELIPSGNNHKFMDVACYVDGECIRNFELQSYPVYEPKMEDMYKYRVFAQADNYRPFKTTVFATYNPNQGISELELDGDVTFHPDFFYTKKFNSREIIKGTRDKIINNIPLTDDEAIDILLIPDMNHNHDMMELLQITSELLCNATIPDKEFHLDLITCQKKVLQRFFKKDERKEMEKMLNLKAKDYGIEPNVTGFEEEMNLAYLDGKREGYDDGKKAGFDDAQLDTARNLLDLGVEEEIIVKATGLSFESLQKLKNDKNII